MEEKEIVTSSIRTKVSTGYNRLDEALQGGFLAGTAIVLSAPASDEVPLLIGNFLRAPEQGLLICRTFSSAEMITQNLGENVRSLICSDKPVSPARTIIPGKGIENLTDLNLQIGEVIASTQPKRLVIDILSDILLRHKALQTRKWLTELLERLRSKGITTLAVLNPYMHSTEDVQAIVDLFDGNLEIFEKQVEGQLRKSLVIKWMHGVDVAEKEFLVADLTAVTPSVVLSVPQPAPSSVLTEPRWLTPLVDRMEEDSRLKRAFEDALANKSSLVALQGESGVGKTRLMRELAVYARSKAGVVLSGRATEEGPPYGPWVELAREYVGQASGELLRRMLGPIVSEFARLVPDIAAKLGTIPPSKPLDPQQDRIRLYEAMTQFLIAICKDSPLLLLLDDMHRADQTSVDLLKYFVRSSSNNRVLTVCSYRTEDLEPNSSLERTLMDLNKERLLETITVKNLSKDDTSNLITQIFGEPKVSTDFADIIYEHTGGNPFFVEEVLRSLVEDGTIFRTEKGWDRKSIQELTVPKSVKATLRSRLAKLEPDSLNILVWAAVAGEEFDFEVVREAAQLDEDALLQRLEKIFSAGLVGEVSHQKGVFRFADNRIRELLLGDLIQVRRARYHLKVAEAIEKMYAKNIDRYAKILAYHFTEASDIPRATKYSIMAGDKSRAMYAYEPAANEYKRALDLIELEEGSEQEKALTLEKLGECYAGIGQLENATQCYEQALAIFEKSHDNKACARACQGLATAILSVKAEAGAQEATLVVKRGLKYIEGEPESAEAATIYCQLAWNHGLMDQYDEANAWAEKAIQVGKSTNNSEAVAGALMVQAAYLTDTGKIDDGLRLWQQAFELSLKHEDYSTARLAVFNLSIYTYPRDLSKARELALRSLDLAKRMNFILGEARSCWILAVIDWFRGDWAAATEQIQKASTLIERLGGASSVAETEAWKGWFLTNMGDLEHAERILQKATAEESPKITWLVTAKLALGLLRLEQGRDQEARTALEACVNAFKNWEFTTEPLLHIETLLHLTQIYTRHGELDKARETSQWAKRLADTLRSDAGLAMASQAEGNVLLADGDGKGAEEAYLKSLGLWGKAGWPYYKAKALATYSLAIAKSKPEESQKPLLEAVEIFRKLGAKRDLSKAETRLAGKA